MAMIKLPKFIAANCEHCTLAKSNMFVKSQYFYKDSATGIATIIDQTYLTTLNLTYVTLDIKAILIDSTPHYGEVMSSFSDVLSESKLIIDDLPTGYYLHTYAIMCRPASRMPTADELLACLPHLEYMLSLHPNCDHLMTFGEVATLAVFNLLGIKPDNTPLDSKFKLGKVVSKLYMSNPTLTITHKKIVPNYSISYVQNAFKYIPIFHNAIDLLFGKNIDKRIEDSIPEYSVINTLALLTKLALELAYKRELVVIDLETNNLQWYDGNRKADNILCIGLATATNIYIIDLTVLDIRDKNVVSYITEILSNNQLIAHNGMFDQLFLRKVNILVPLYFDTLKAHAELEEESEHGLKFLSNQYFGIVDYDDMLAPYLNKNQFLSNYAEIPKNILYKYLSLDLWCTYNLHNIFIEKLEESSQLDYFFNFVMPTNEVAVEMSWNGFKIDAERLDDVKETLENSAIILRGKMQKAMKNDKFNPNSYKQLQDYIYGLLRMPHIEYKHKVMGKWKVDLNSTGKDVLLKMPQTDEIIDLIDYKQVSKLLSNYTDSILEILDTNDRVHPDIYTYGTETGRWSTSNPPIHNIPRSEDRENHFNYGGLIRSTFIPENGNVLVVCDYSQAELRILAALSNDPFLLDAYNNDRDLHTEQAKLIAPNGNWTKFHRGIAKKINFGFIYYAGAFIIAQQANIPFEDARRYVQRAEVNMVRAVQWRQEMLDFVKLNGYVKTRFGKIRHIPFVVESNLDSMKKAAVNSPIQGGAGQLTAYAAIQVLNWIRELNREFWNIKLILSVHDSIILECPKEHSNIVASRLESFMVDAGKAWYPEVKWKADVEIKERWAKIPSQIILN